MGFYAKRKGFDGAKRKYCRIIEDGTIVDFSGVRTRIREYADDDQRVKEKEYESTMSDVLEKLERLMVETANQMNRDFCKLLKPEEYDDIILQGTLEDYFNIRYSEEEYFALSSDLQKIYADAHFKVGEISRLIETINMSYIVDEVTIENQPEHFLERISIVETIYSQFKEDLDECGFNLKWVKEPVIVSSDAIYQSNDDPESIDVFSKEHLYEDITFDSAFTDFFEEIEGDE